MKYQSLYGILGGEAALCLALCVAQASFAGVFSAMLAFPFEQIGLGLRALSLSGGLGNAAAVALYAALSLLPAAVLFLVRKKRGLQAEDGLLALLSAALFAVLYLMINPGLLGALAGADGAGVGKAILGCILYSVLCGYLILRALRLFFHGDAEKLAGYMSLLLGLLGAVFVYLAFGACFSGLLGSLVTLRAGNVGNEHLLGASYVFLVLQYLVNALPYVLDVLVVLAALRLLEELRANRYSAAAVAAAGRMSRLCMAALAAVVSVNIGFNLLQLLFIKALVVMNVSVNIPLLSIAFVLAALLLTRFVAENKQLKDDNDMFI